MVRGPTKEEVIGLIVALLGREVRVLIDDAVEFAGVANDHGPWSEAANGVHHHLLVVGFAKVPADVEVEGLACVEAVPGSLQGRFCLAGKDLEDVD